MIQRKNDATETKVEKIWKTGQVPYFRSFPIFKFIFTTDLKNYINISLTDNSTNKKSNKSTFKTVWHSPHSLKRTIRTLPS